MTLVYFGFSFSRSIHSRMTPPTISTMQISAGRLEQHGLDEAVRQRADHGRRQEGEQDAGDEMRASGSTARAIAICQSRAK
jgi:hypothetical protein